jgi:hypothetical protein
MGQERALFLSERESGVYSTFAHFVSAVACDLLPLRILPPCAFTLLAYPLIGLQHHTWCANTLLT